MKLEVGAWTTSGGLSYSFPGSRGSGEEAELMVPLSVAAQPGTSPPRVWGGSRRPAEWEKCSRGRWAGALSPDPS